MEKPQKPVAVYDVVLSSLVQFANNEKSKLELGITLNVKGTIVSGMLVGSGTYYTGVAEFMRSGGGDIGVVLGDFLDSISEPLKKDNETETLDAPNFIHLKNAKFYTPGGASAIPNSHGVWWRGKLSSIDGFTIGNLF